MSAATLIDRLERVKETGSGRWLARCPAHADKSPSLSIKELDDGRTLIRCFAGCGAIDVLEAVGLGWSALFPEKLPEQAYPPSHSPRIPARDLLQIVSAETSIVAIIAADMIAKKNISDTDWQRFALAASRIGKACDHVR